MWEVVVKAVLPEQVGERLLHYRVLVVELSASSFDKLFGGNRPHYRPKLHDRDNTTVQFNAGDKSADLGARDPMF
jgi:hypothetical protein